MLTHTLRSRWSPPARLAAAAAAALPLTAMGQVVYYFESFDSAAPSQVSQDPTMLATCGGGPGAGVWTKNFPAGWALHDCGVPTYYCRVGRPSGTCPDTGLCNPQCTNTAGILEWEGWSIANRSWWVQVAGDQNRSQFTLSQGNCAIADPDEWDDQGNPASLCGFYNAFVSTPVINLGGVDLSSLQFALASSWRPEGFDDGDGTNNQTATIEAIYSTPSGEVVVEILRYDSDSAGAFYKPDATNEQVTISAAALNAPADATAVRFRLGLTNAGNDWWWAVDNLELTGSVAGVPTNIFAENFDSVTLGPPQEEGGTPCARTYCNQPTYTLQGPNGVTVTNDPGVSGGVPDWRGWSFSTVPFWDCVSAQNRGQFVLGDGVVAIADGDEWTDTAPNSGTLNTLLSTPSINIARRQGDVLILSFDSSWRDEPEQVGEIYAEYQTPSGTQTVLVTRFDSNPASPDYKAANLSEVVNLPLRVPPAATSVVIRFLYVAGNNWWWAIDDLRVLQGVVTVPISNESPRQRVMALAPSIDFAPCFTPWSPDGPAGWTEDPFFPAGCTLSCGRAEWRGWSFANREWWSTNVDDQGRSEFTRARGYAAIADPDEWDDTGNGLSVFDAFMNSPAIAIPADASSIEFTFDSSWRPEGFDDGTNGLGDVPSGQNNQTATIEAIYQTPGGQVTREVLRWDSDNRLDVPGREGQVSPFFHPDNTNEGVTLDHAALQVPPGATSVSFRFGLTKARNDWWWAVDNLRLSADGTEVFAEDFEQPTNLQQPPTENPPTTLCIYYSSVAAQGSGYTTNNSGITSCSGPQDFLGFNAWLTEAWARAGGGPRGQFGSRTAYVSDFQQLGCAGTAFLQSPSFDARVLNPGTAAASFRSGWLAAAGHRSTVEVSFDGGGTWSTVLDWDADAAPGSPAFKASNPDELVSVPLNNPAGSQSITIRIGDRNSGYWALSEITITGEIGSPVCVADYNFDGNLDPDDLSDYISCFFSAPPCPETDLNADGNIDPDDLADYIALYFAGC
ncbi:MAG: hypothetical protein JNK35_06070 [Phycisphaerae bacterium]|nr:hypothetical protein [Phycisphaerae bacterium]